MTTPRQQTIAEPRELSGTGLHTGIASRIRLLPGAVDTGIVFRRTDLPGSPEVPADLESVVDTDRGTTIGSGDVRIHTVEHVLAAVVGTGLDNLAIELEGPEPPAGDGSALPFVDLIRAAGTTEQDGPIRKVSVSEPFVVSEAGARYVVTASTEYEISTTIEFDHPSIGRQFASFTVVPETFRNDVAPARTFGFLQEVESLRSRGLARGGSPDNALVLTEDGLMPGTTLRFPDEFARHKILDVVGDLALLGARLNAHVVATRPSHRGNVALGREIRSRARKAALARPILNIQQILQYLPHRYPFLLVDRVIEFEERKRIVGLKNVTINEPFFAGHFPGHPIMPGVLIIEAMAQVGGLLVMEAIENPEEKIVYFMSLDKVKWRRPVTPGDQIRFEVDIVQIRGQTARMRGLAIVDGQTVAEAEMMARIVDR